MDVEEVKTIICRLELIPRGFQPEDIIAGMQGKVVPTFCFIFRLTETNAPSPAQGVDVVGDHGTEHAINSS